MSAELSVFYHPQAFVGNYLLPRLKDPQFLQVGEMPSDQALIISDLLSGMEIPIETSLHDLEYLLSSALAPEVKTMLSDFVHLTILIKLLQNIKENYSAIFTELNNISDTKFNKDFIYDLVWPELCRNIESETTTEALIKYLPLFKQMDESKRESCYDALFLQVCQIVDISKNDAMYIAQQLANLYELREVQVLEVIVETLLQQLMNIVSQFETVKGLREEYKGGFELCPEEEIQAAFGLLKGVEVQGVLKERFEGYKQVYQAKSQIIHNDEENNDKQNPENQKEKLINFESDSFNTLGLEDTLIEANKVIQTLPIKNFAQIKILEKVWAVNLPEKHLEVFKALIKDQDNNDMLVALKCNYTRSVEKSLSDQAEYMALMQKNRNFLKLFGSFWDIDDKSKKNRYNLVMEYAPETLSSRIDLWEREQTPKSIREAEALLAAKELIQGMRDLNDKNISHRDLKPDNVFITQENVYKIADFDVSKKHEKNQYGITVTSVNAGFAGTQVFLSPELWDLQHNGKNFGRINYNKSDVYSLGLTILRMVTNRNCNSWNCFSDFLESNMQRIIEEEVSNVKLKGIIKMMLIVDPETRPKFRFLAQEFNEVEATFICE